MTTSTYILVCVIGFGLASAFFTLLDTLKDLRRWVRAHLTPRGYTTADRGDLNTDPSLQAICARSFASLVDHAMIDA
jgi:hypothetical protein